MLFIYLSKTPTGVHRRPPEVLRQAISGGRKKYLACFWHLLEIFKGTKIKPKTFKMAPKTSKKAPKSMKNEVWKAVWRQWGPRVGKMSRATDKMEVLGSILEAKIHKNHEF